MMPICHWCGIETHKGARDPLRRPTRDHVIARAYGGGSNPGNIVNACRGCNEKRSLEMQLDWMKHGGKNSTYCRDKWARL